MNEVETQLIKDVVGKYCTDASDMAAVNAILERTRVANKQAAAAKAALEEAAAKKAAKAAAAKLKADKEATLAPPVKEAKAAAPKKPAAKKKA